MLVWNNGDNTDIVNGNAGADEVEVNGAPARPTLHRYQRRPRRVRPHNLVPFTLDFGAERLTVNGLRGDDTSTATPGSRRSPSSPSTAAPAPTGSRGDGPDLITGGDDADKLDGAGGDDRVVGDRGADRL